MKLSHPEIRRLLSALLKFSVGQNPSLS